MADASDKTLLVIIRHSPYGSSLARSGLDTALAMAAFGQPVALLFLGDGVLQLLPAQDSKAIGRRNVGKLLASLPLYDIESVFVDAESAHRYRIDPDGTYAVGGPAAPGGPSNHLFSGTGRDDDPPKNGI